ncbi:peptidylprolyl isomerase PrsA [Ectobacillus panaciterrae]|uniref:peptidylprolyl isomerase PrsA n=1 Tax=Ectobacillus panaciterrae TaxID=363872 RepID=UPI00040D5AA5|nr:peptidylprolyl isomerase PrsA [Ectobacillus panaciterrae]
MKKAIIALAATSVLALSACGSSDTIVKSSSGNVTKEEFYDAMKQRAGQSVLKQLVIEKVFTKKYNISDKDVDKEYDSSKKQYGDQFESLLKQNGMTTDSFKKQIRASLALKKAVGDSFTDKELKANYKPEIKASHILVADEATAKKVKDLLNQGQSFEDLAKQYSTDTGSKDKGGDLGYFGPGKMVPEFEAAAYKLKKGEVSDPVKSQYGYHIIKVTDIKELKPFDEVKGTIKDQLVETKMQDSTFMNDFVDKELKKANVTIEDKDLKDALKPAADQSTGQSTTGQ